MKISGYTLVFILISMCAFSSAPASEKTDNSYVYGLIDNLTALKPFSVDGINKIINVKHKAVETANPYFDFYEFSKKDGPVKKIELRVPNSLSDKKDGMVIIDFSDSLEVTLDDLYAKYGKKGWIFEPPSPEAPAKNPDYHSIIINRQKVTFGIGRDKTQRLKSIIVDRI